MLNRILFSLFFLIAAATFIFADNLVVYPTVFDENDNLLCYDDLIKKGVNLKNVELFVNSPASFIAKFINDDNSTLQSPIKILWNISDKNSFFINGLDYNQVIEKGYMQTATLKEEKKFKVQIFQIKNNSIIGTGKFKEITVKENESIVSILNIKEITDELLVYSPDLPNTQLNNIFNIKFVAAPPAAFDVILNGISSPIILNTLNNSEIIKYSEYQVKLNSREGKPFQSSIVIQLPDGFYFTDEFGEKINPSEKYLIKYFVYKFKNDFPVTDAVQLSNIITVKSEKIIVLNPVLLPQEFLSFNFKVSTNKNVDLINKSMEKIKLIINDYSYVLEEPLYISTEKNSLKFAGISSYIIEENNFDSIKSGEKVKYQLVINNIGSEDLMINSINYLNGNPQVDSIFLLDSNLNGNIIANFKLPFIVKPKDIVVVKYNRAVDKTGYYIEKAELNYDLFYRDSNEELKKINDTLIKSQITLVK